MDDSKPPVNAVLRLGYLDLAGSSHTFDAILVAGINSLSRLFGDLRMRVKHIFGLALRHDIISKYIL